MRNREKSNDLKPMEVVLLKPLENLAAPGPGWEEPVFIEDSPGLGYYFPLSREDVLEELSRLPNHLSGLIHYIKFSRFSPSDFEEYEQPLIDLLCESGVRLMVLYSWPLNRQIRFGPKKPGESAGLLFSAYASVSCSADAGFHVQFSEECIRDFIAEGLINQQVGRHLEWQNCHWRSENRGEVENPSRQYVFSLTSKRSLILR